METRRGWFSVTTRDMRYQKMHTDKSEMLTGLAEKVMPGGVNSPVRAFGAVGGRPRFIARGEGAYLIDVDGNRYLDFWNSWGPLILGHADPDVVGAVKEQVDQGMTYGATTELEYQLADAAGALASAIKKETHEWA